MTALWTPFFIMFAGTAILPGPNVAFSVAQSLRYGSRKAIPAAIGFSLGTGGHALIVLSGIGLLAREYGFILTAIKWAGVCYLLYLAAKAFSVKGEQQIVEAAETSVSKLILGAILVSFTNPKGLISSLLIYPAFVDPGRPYLPQALVLGATGMLISLVVYSGYIVIAQHAGGLFRNRTLLNKLVGSIYIGIAAVLIITS